MKNKSLHFFFMPFNILAWLITIVILMGIGLIVAFSTNNSPGLIAVVAVIIFLISISVPLILLVIRSDPDEFFETL